MVPRVQGYRPESFGTLTNPVVSKGLIGKCALRDTTLQISLLKESWTTPFLAENCTHLSISSSDC